MIGQFTAYLNVLQYSYITGVTGDSEAVLSDRFFVYGKVENRRGGSAIFTGQRVQNYDYKITCWYDERIVEDNAIMYDGKMLSIEQIEYQDEGARQYMILRCNAQSQAIGGILVNGAVYRFDGLGNGTNTITAVETIEKRILTVCYDGIGFGQIITSGTPTGKQVRFNTLTGEFVTAMPIEPDQTVYILYQ